ncbi:actin-related protein 2/3 complex subunit 5-like [Mytilus galloprovincialis]|uniref:Actin-related protein 2/3 complex subunit 5 n=1 Tax=Mytilus galloprovincialis TaxID=29158 RepID=A0A8B6DAL8_MYTGA|nr:actin related protein 2/3 complex, subunit 5 [Mytilus galloprovincialis]VDI37435.1 actin related protein 2/3 complex, subunit 5 [Mytilus galloprovincialis]
MSKSGNSRAFRKVDVDQFDEDKYEEQDDENEQISGPNESDVNALLAQGKNSDALKSALKNAPVGSKDQKLKNKAVQLVTRVLTSFKSNEIDSCVKSLDTVTLDLLMKYIYKGFENPSEGSSGALLTWHEKAFASGGLGTVMRVLTDRKCV